MLDDICLLFRRRMLAFDKCLCECQRLDSRKGGGLVPSKTRLCKKKKKKIQNAIVHFCTLTEHASSGST